MATIRKMRDKWQAIIKRSGFPLQSKSFLIKADARKWAREAESALDNGIVVTGKNITTAPIAGVTVSADTPSTIDAHGCPTVADMLKRYRDTVAIHHKGYGSENARIKVFLKQKWSKLALSDANALVFSRYRDVRLKSVMPSTVKRDLGLLASIFEIARKEWCLPIAHNPIHDISKPKVPDARTRRLEVNELPLLMTGCEASRSPYLKSGILLAIETGMRRGELLSVTWDDLSYDNATLLIRETKNGSARTIPLSDKALTILRSVQDANNCHPRRLRKICKVDNPTHIKRDNRIVPISASAFQLQWQRCKKRVAKTYPDIITLHFHDLRHEAISRFFELGLSIAEVALISGHKDIRMLFRYTHLRAENIVHKLNNLQMRE